MRRDKDREHNRDRRDVGGVESGAEIEDEPDFAEEHAPSETDPANARASDGWPDERWDKPTQV
ncbi:hypothetical protein ACFY05_18040 [Microtetraspora fusca]|uniref:Uncharacterized protein n=1 Tax=Microtetraspora fusca TaxID=1997 RepID=A0ABW6V612_MICFU